MLTRIKTVWENGLFDDKNLVRTVQHHKTCYTASMTTDAPNSDDLTTEPEAQDTASTNETTEPATAGQLWRDRLNKTKTDTKRGGPAGAAGDADLRTRFQNTSSGGTARKSRKGMRPG
jgi:hypothetical protein